MSVEQTGGRFKTVADVGRDRARTGVHGDSFESESPGPGQDSVDEPATQSAVTLTGNYVYALQVA